MRASQLVPFLLILLHSATLTEGVPLDEAINWKECGDNAVCRVHGICNDPSIPDEASLVELERFTVSKDKRKCDLGIHIKPETMRKWIVSMVASTTQRKQAATTLTWSVGESNPKEVFKCEGNKATRGKDIAASEISIRDLPQSSSEQSFCVFTVESGTGERLSLILDRHRKMHSIMHGTENLHARNFNFEDVNKALLCKQEDLFVKECDETEECVPPKNVKYGMCPPSYKLLFRKEKSSNFIESTIRCDGGEFKWGPNDEDIVLGQSEAKCMRKRCTLCNVDANKNLKDLFKPVNGTEYPCARLNCTDAKPFMVFNMTSNGQTSLRSSLEPLQCADSNKTANYWMYGDARVQIESAECKESVSCDNEGGQSLVSRCKPEEKKEHQCITARRTATGSYVCDKEGFSLRAIFNETAVAVEPPTCESDGTWQFNFTDNSTSIPMGSKEEELVVNCYLDQVPKTAEKVSESGNSAWIIAIVVLVIIIVVAVAIAVFCFLKRKKAAKKAPSSSVPSKTSSSSNTKTSGKPSSSDQEPLTSAIVSITGDSVQTAKAKTPMFAKADLRPPVPSSETSTKRTTKKESKKKREEKDERVEKTCEQGDSDSTRKARIEAAIKKGQEKELSFYESSNNQEKDLTSTKDATKATPVRSAGSGEDRTLLKSQTGGDGESRSQVEKIGGESAKLIPKAPRKYSTTKPSTKEPKINNKFLNITDSSEDEQSKTGSKKRRVNKRK